MSKFLDPAPIWSLIESSAESLGYRINRPGRIVRSLTTIRPSNTMYSTQSWKYTLREPPSSLLCCLTFAKHAELRHLNDSFRARAILRNNCIPMHTESCRKSPDLTPNKVWPARLALASVQHSCTTACNLASAATVLPMLLLCTGPAMKNIDLHKSRNAPSQFVQHFNSNIMQTSKHTKFLLVCRKNKMSSLEAGHR